MKIDELKSELQEMKGCQSEFESETTNFYSWICGEEDLTGSVLLCPTCQAKIEYLKKGISACEEILNQCRQNRNQKPISSKEENLFGLFGQSEKTGSADNTLTSKGFKEAINKSGLRGFQFEDTQTLIKQGNFNTSMNRKVCYEAGYRDALSQRNQEIFKIIEKITSWTCKCGCITFDDKKCRMCGSDPAYGEIDYDDLMKQLTNSEGEE